MELKIGQQLLFVLGKGGVGRTTIAAAIASRFASRGEKVLLVQWAFHDAITAVFGVDSSGHAAQELAPNLFAMNFSPSEAQREYFVTHLGMKSLYDFVIQHGQVQRLIRAVPGIYELFFLGRLFWLAELAEAERGWRYDRIVVDAPATGHGAGLFSLPSSIASFGIAGPLASECRRVAAFLANEEKVGTVVVTNPEELPVEESMELIGSLRRTLGRNPLFVCVNRCLETRLAEIACCGKSTPTTRCSGVSNLEWLRTISASLSSPSNAAHVETMFVVLCQRRAFEAFVREQLEQQKLPAVFVPDVHFENPDATPCEVVLDIEKRLGF